MSFKGNKQIILCFIMISLLRFAEATPSPKHFENLNKMQETVLIHINKYRQLHGLSPLIMNNKVVAIAKQHSMDMATHKVPFGHKYFTKRIAKLHTQIKNFGAGAENVAYNYKDARTVVQQWILSPGHKRNILGNYSITGIGIVRDLDGKLYYTQIFLQTNRKRHNTRKIHFSGFPFFKIITKSLQ